MNSLEEPCIIASQINHFWNQEKEKEILDVFNEEIGIKKKKFLMFLAKKS